MLTDAEITAAASRLNTGKLTESDVDSLVSAFRLLLGPLEVTYNYDLVTDLEALDDTANTRKKAAKLAAILIRLQAEDFGVASLLGDFENLDSEQRRLLIAYGFTILYTLPAELAYLDLISRAMIGRVNSSSVPITFVP